MNRPKESIRDTCELGLPMAGLISEEEVPSLYSLSLSDSMCSSSTVDLDVEEQSGTYPMYGYTHPFHSSQLENNFMEEKQYKATEIHQNSTSDTVMDMSNSLNNTSRNCISLHDVSSLVPLQLPVNSTNTVSCETIHSQSLSSTTKSKDSGFQRSVSCLSLNSGKRNYDHVESKVKAYIRNIKESQALRKQQLLAEKAVIISEVTKTPEFDPCLDKEDLVQKVQELQDELNEKALFIDIQQKNYNSLLLKLAEAKNTIDTLRVRRISLNYSTGTTFDESQNTRIDDIDLGVFEQEIRKQQNKIKNSIFMSCGSNLNENSSFVPLKPLNNSFSETFKPKTNSTPQNKDSNKGLSPVSKIFSSSSRLDRGFRPLASLKKEKTSSVSMFNDSNRSNVLFQSTGKKAQNVCTGHLKSKMNKISNGRQKSTLLCNKKHMTANIDLPNVDPFDKVKKWQASLPSINLLGAQSSSECEDSLHASKSTNNIQGQSENDINGCLSLELMSKLKISEEPSKSSSCINIAMFKKESMSQNLRNFSVKNASTNFKSKKDQDRGQFEFESVLLTRKSNGNNIENYNSNIQVLTEPSLPSTSENKFQTYLPKSSSWAYTSERQLKSDCSDSADDSSSVSSSSSESPSFTSSNKSSSKFALCKSKTEVTLPKQFKSTLANTKIILRKPKLNYEPMTNISNFKNDKVLQKKAQSLNNSSSNLKDLKVESSQRKAWNERNTTNFYVCKEFYLKRSSSLQECLNIMKNMVEEGSSIIETSLERSHCH